jgi:hypothetical protein
MIAELKNFRNWQENAGAQLTHLTRQKMAKKKKKNLRCDLTRGDNPINVIL